ncbi:MAG TPA: hypothetical protein VND45_05135, partial [Thermoanaerobaculia bacterium]|nr:hypothetical protein [Thermoanaerobaculia bacterium]
MTNFVSRVAVLLFAALIAIPLLAEGTHVRMVNGTVVAFSDGGDAASYDRVRMGGREVTLTLVNVVPYATMRNGKLDGSATWNAGVPPAGPAASRRRLGGYYNARIGNETGFSRHLYGDAIGHLRRPDRRRSHGRHQSRRPGGYERRALPARPTRTRRNGPYLRRRARLRCALGRDRRERGAAPNVGRASARRNAVALEDKRRAGF